MILFSKKNSGELFTIILSDFIKIFIAYITLTLSVKPLVVFFWLPGYV